MRPTQDTQNVKRVRNGWKNRRLWVSGPARRTAAPSSHATCSPAWWYGISTAATVAGPWYRANRVSAQTALWSSTQKAGAPAFSGLYLGMTATERLKKKRTARAAVEADPGCAMLGVTRDGGAVHAVTTDGLGH